LSNPTARHRSAPSSRARPIVQALEDRLLFAAVPRFDHVVVVIEENHSPSQVIGSAEAPYINSLARNGAYFSQSFGTNRPSQPNYLALFSGSNQGVTSNSDVNLGNIPNLGSQLIAAGKSFVEYSEDLPYVGFTGSTFGRYARKHNPAVSFSNVPAASNRPFTDFPSDYTTLPTVSFVVPNLDNDSHDGTVDASDQWLQAKLSGYAEWAKAHNSLLIVTYDEGSGTDTTNHIATIAYGANVKQGTYANTIKHYNVLRTIEDMYVLTPLANAAGAATIDYIWNTAPPPPPPPGVPAAPTSLTATAISGTQINIAWTDNATNESGYKIERSTDGTNFYALAATGVNGKSYQNTGLSAGRRYYYRVYAINAAGRSSFSNVGSAVTLTTTPPPPPPPPSGAPAAPTSLVLTRSASVANEIDLKWLDNATNETGYKIERSTDGINFYALAGAGVNATAYHNTNLTPGKRYFYRVYAINAAGRSAFSNVASLIL
jgi:hypothetical protein